LLQLPQIIVLFLQRTEKSEKPLQKNHWYFMPTSHTCSNTFDLARGIAVIHLPLENELFELNDPAFKNDYFGVMQSTLICLSAIQALYTTMQFTFDL